MNQQPTQFKSIGLTEILRLLNECSAVILDEPGSPLMYPGISEADYDKEPFMELRWYADHVYYDLQFSQFPYGSMACVDYTTGRLTLLDDDGNSHTLTLLRAGCDEPSVEEQETTLESETVLIPRAIAETITQDPEMVELMIQRADYHYKNLERFRAGCNGDGSRGRDFLYAFMSRWNEAGIDLMRKWKASLPPPKKSNSAGHELLTAEEARNKRKQLIRDLNDQMWFAAKHTGEYDHAWFTRRDWRTEVTNTDTVLGYQEWVDHQIESNEPS